MFYRLTLDAPYSFRIEQGYHRTLHCADFRPLPNSQINTWREPVTGLVMLRPNFLMDGFFNNLKHLSDFTHSSETFWVETQRTTDNALMLSTTSRDDVPATDIAISVNPALVTLTLVADPRTALRLSHTL